MDPYAPTAVALPASIDLPADDDSPVAHVVFQPPLATLADAIKYVHDSLGLPAATIQYPICFGQPQRSSAATDSWVYDGSSDGAGWVQNNVTTNLELSFELTLPVNTEITAIGMNHRGQWNGTVHSAKPATLPKISLYRIDASGVRTLEFEGSDGSSTKAAYETPHSTITSGLASIAASTRYVVVVRGETSTDSLPNAHVLRAIYIAKNGP